jgi:transposase InsO family protein
MPWKEIDVMDQKKEFVFRSLGRSESFTELCKEYGIATKTGYKWRKRFIEKGWAGLEELTRRPKTSGRGTAEEIVVGLIAIKNRHMGWGARKIQKNYQDHHPGVVVPAVSTVTRIFEKAGLVRQRRKRRCKPDERIQNRIAPKNPNDVWTVDFKGWWYTREKEQVNPLTVRDEYSKYILSIKVMERGDIFSVRKEFERLFKLHGLPECIRSDNGPPFASSFNALGLTKLAVWWMSLGIQLDRIDPGCPYQNGGHERMHLDMKKELEGQIDGNLEEHQRVFDGWREEYNTERPHEALKMRCPANVYKDSTRKYETEEELIEYPRGYKARKVNDRGFFNLSGRRYFIGNPFAGYTIGIRYKKESKPEIWFMSEFLGNLDIEKGLIVYEARTKMIKAS